MKSYLERLSPRLAAIGVRVQPHLTQSNGGVRSCESAQQQPVRLILSGPAAGIMGALKTGEAAGVENLITFDMGGTSSDVSLIDRGKAQMVNDVEVHGYPLKAPMIDIHTVGAGGGSVAYVDVGGLLKVGPRSAGADPGPACYGRGSTEPTVTDANVLMQVLNPVHLLGGRMPIDRSLSEAAIVRLAEKLGLSLMETAHGIIRIVTANMAKAIRVISVERGYDPRDYTMMAFGGAGPLHAARLARELEMPRVMIPKYPGILCAMGLLVADLRSNFAITRMGRLEPAAADGIETGFHGLEKRAEAWFEQEGIAPAHRRVSRAIDMRYGGQGYELTIAAPEGPVAAEMLPELRRRFEQNHRQIYGYVAAEEAVQVTTLRIEALGEVRKIELPRQERATTSVADAITGSRKVYFGEVRDFVESPLYDREKLQPGHSFAGPALVDQMDSTSLVLPGQTATVDAHLNLFIEG